MQHYLTIVRTPHDPEDEDSGYLCVSHVQLPPFKAWKGGSARNKQTARAAYNAFVLEELVQMRMFPELYAEALVDWLVAADPGDSFNLDPFGGCDGAVLVLHYGSEPAHFGLLKVSEPKFVLHNLEDDGEGGDEDEEDSEIEEDEWPARKPLPPKKKPR